MYSKFSTQAIVLKKEETGEKDALLSLFTREYGFIYAKVKGIQTQDSRLRFALQPMTLCFVTLVHGKNNWILTNATFIYSYYFETINSLQRRTIVQILHLISRLYIGEQPHVVLFDFIENQLKSISQKKLKDNQIKSFEVFIVFKLLDALGYIQEDKILAPIMSSDELNDSLANYIFENKKNITPFINLAIRTSGL